MSSARNSHPWIDFNLRINLKPDDWMNLGEARSKCAHLAGVPMQPGIAADLSQVFLVKGAVATTAIEGNTLTEQEVQSFLSGAKTVERSREYQLVEVENVLNAIKRLDAALRDQKPIPLTVTRLLEVNREVLEGTEHETSAVPGKFRKHSVTVGSVYRGPDWEEIPSLCEKLCTWLAGPFDYQAGRFSAHRDDERLAIALVKAVIAHVYIAWIHPFGDGNGRTARLIEVQVLSQAGVPLLATNLLSDHYNQTRDRYYRELKAASDTGGNLTEFVSYAIEGFVDGLRKQIDIVRLHQLRIAWKNFVFETLQGKSAAEERRRLLLLDLVDKGVVRRSEITHISPRVAESYGGAGERTLPRDLNALMKQGLIIKTPGGLSAALGQVAAFMPTFVAR